MVFEVRMPAPSGFDLQHALLRLDEPLPIIFVTDQRDIPISVHSMKTGVVDFLPKPVESEALLLAVRTALAVQVKRTI